MAATTTYVDTSPADGPSIGATFEAQLPRSAHMT